MKVTKLPSTNNSSNNNNKITFNGIEYRLFRKHLKLTLDGRPKNGFSFKKLGNNLMEDLRHTYADFYDDAITFETPINNLHKLKFNNEEKDVLITYEETTGKLTYQEKQRDKIKKIFTWLFEPETNKISFYRGLDPSNLKTYTLKNQNILHNWKQSLNNWFKRLDTNNVSKLGQ